MSTRKIIRTLIAMLIVTVLLGLLILSAIIRPARTPELNSDLLPLIRSETVYIFLIFIIGLPILVFAMIVILHKRRRAQKKEDDTDDLIRAITPEPALTPEEVQAYEDAVSKAEEQENSEEELAEEESEEPSELPDPRFCMLSEIDRRMEEYRAPEYDREIGLAGVCEEFRNFAASKLKLYYEKEDIRRFVANMAVSHILIMQGMSGTGKTSMAYAFGEFMKNHSVILPIQPMWKERTDMIGYYNEFTKRFNETVLLQKMYEACYTDDIYVVVLDEVNIARVEYYFAEFLSLLEIPDPDKRNLDVVSDVWENDPKLLRNGRLRLPTNMWFIGTANNDDSTFAISDKVYDRSMIMNLDKKTRVFEPKEGNGVRLSASYFEELAAEARREYSLTRRNRQRLQELDGYLINRFKITFGNRIMKQINYYIPAFLACGGDELEALDDILSKKVFRKLESQNPIYVRNSVDDLCAYLDDLFGYDKMPLCKEYLRKFERSA